MPTQSQTRVLLRAEALELPRARGAVAIDAALTRADLPPRICSSACRGGDSHAPSVLPRRANGEACNCLYGWVTSGTPCTGRRGSMVVVHGPGWAGTVRASERCRVGRRFLARHEPNVCTVGNHRPS